MSNPHQLTAFSLQDVAGDELLQETPYPVVAPRRIETVSMIVQYARIEGLKILVLGTGSSFADSFRPTAGGIIAVMTYRLSGIQQLTPYVARVLCGTPISSLFRGELAADRKTLGGLIAGCTPGRDAAAHAVFARLLAVEVVTAEAKVVRLAGSNLVHASDPALAGILLGSRGRAGIITAVEMLCALPLVAPGLEDGDRFMSSASAHDSAISRTDFAQVADPDSRFGW